MKHRISRRAFLRGCTLLAASAAVGSLTSCGGTNAKDSGLPQIIVGSDTYPPYIYLNNDGVPAGIDVEIATEAFRRMGYAARFETIDWEQKTNLVESGAIDCIWGCFSMQGREEMYRWAGPYMVSRQVAAVDADSSIRSLSDLADKTVAVQSTGKPEEIFLSGSDPRIPQTVEVLSIENRSVQYALLSCGYVDAIAAHETGHPAIHEGQFRGVPHFGGTAAGHRAGHRLCQERHPQSGQPVDRHPCADARGRHAGADRWQVS
ncbi:MAG: substrate-binding periplasmic protein [Faecalibacterium prausnitzii]